MNERTMHEAWVRWVAATQHEQRHISPGEAWRAAWAQAAAETRMETLAEVASVAQHWAEEAQLQWQANPTDRGVEGRTQLRTIEANGVLEAVRDVRAASATPSNLLSTQEVVDLIKHWRDGGHTYGPASTQAVNKLLTWLEFSWGVRAGEGPDGE